MRKTTREPNTPQSRASFLLSRATERTAPLAAVQTQPTKRALVIGIGDYESPVFPDLQYPTNDIARVEELLGSPTYGFKITSLNDSTTDKPTRANILSTYARSLITGLRTRVMS